MKHTLVEGSPRYIVKYKHKVQKSLYSCYNCEKNINIFEYIYAISERSYQNLTTVITPLRKNEWLGREANGRLSFLCMLFYYFELVARHIFTHLKVKLQDISQKSRILLICHWLVIVNSPEFSECLNLYLSLSPLGKAMALQKKSTLCINYCIRKIF